MTAKEIIKEQEEIIDRLVAALLKISKTNHAGYEDFTKAELDRAIKVASIASDAIGVSHEKCRALWEHIINLGIPLVTGEDLREALND